MSWGRAARISRARQQGPAESGLIQEPDIQRRLVRAYGLRDRTAAATLAPELVPVVIVDDVREPDATRTGLRIPFAAYTEVTVGAGGSGVAVLKNPAGSGVVARVTEVMVSQTVAVFIAFGWFNLATLTTTSIHRGPLNPRRQGAQTNPPFYQSVCRMEDDPTTGPAIVTGLWAGDVRDFFPVPCRQWPGALVLPPGTMVGWRSTSIGNHFVATFQWTEGRDLEA